ncbi:MAG: iron-siderophore ABC transporter substrate-binding protein [Thermomicrobiales bacterium]
MNDSGLTRRRFATLAASSAAGIAVAGTLQGNALAARQDASPAASPAADGDIFAGIDLKPGVVPTAFGDVTVPANPTRVVAITDGAIDAAVALGIEMIGVTSSANFETVAAYLADKVDPAITYVGGWGELDVEKIVELKPDLILADSYLNAQDEGLYDTLSAVAPVVAPTLYEATGIDGLQRWEYEQLIYGHALGKTEESKQLAHDLRDRAAGIAPTLGDNTGKSVIVFRPQPEFAVIMAQRWITGVMLTWSGLAGTPFTEELEPPHSGDSVGLERLNLLDADWLFAALRDADMAAELEVYKENPIFQTVPAYQSGQIVSVSGDLWSGAIGILAGHAMMDDIERILVRGDLEATPAG